jgi:hypothetical protein
LYSNQIQLVPKMYKNSYRGRISFHASFSTKLSFRPLYTMDLPPGEADC